MACLRYYYYICVLILPSPSPAAAPAAQVSPMSQGSAQEQSSGHICADIPHVQERGEGVIWRRVSAQVSAEGDFLAGEAKNEVRRHEVLAML